jgi:hypothetical protein
MLMNWKRIGYWMVSEWGKLELSNAATAKYHHNYCNRKSQSQFPLPIPLDRPPFALPRGRLPHNNLRFAAKLYHILLPTGRAAHPVARGALALDQSVPVGVQCLWIQREAGLAGVTAHDLGHQPMILWVCGGGVTGSSLQPMADSSRSRASANLPSSLAWMVSSGSPSSTQSPTFL